MKRARLCLTGLNEGLRKNMLSAVLLEVVKTALSVNASFDALPGDDEPGLLDDMKNCSVISFDDVDDSGIIDLAGVVRLPAACRIKSGLVKHQAVCAINAVNADHLCLKLQEA